MRARSVRRIFSNKMAIYIYIYIYTPADFYIFLPCLAAPLGLPQGNRVAPKVFNIQIFMSNGHHVPEQ